MPISITINFNPSPPCPLPYNTFLSPLSPSLILQTTFHRSLSLISNPRRPLFIALCTNSSATNNQITTNLSTDGCSGETGGRNALDGDGEKRHTDEVNNDKIKKLNKAEALMVLAEAERGLGSLPMDLRAAIKEGMIPGSIVCRYFELEKSWVLSWLIKFVGFKERLLADDLFLAKVVMECGIGIFTKTAAEYERRGLKFFDELEIVFADVVMAVIADFMLVYLPAPTVSLRPAIAPNTERLAKFFYSCPDNAFQVALPGSSFSLLQRLGSIVQNGSKLFVVGTTSSLVGTIVTNALINAHNIVDHSAATENVPVISVSVAYGVYMALSSNLRYQVVAGVIEQRILEPLLNENKILLSATCFAVRTGNTFLGSLLWVDFARFIGI